MLTAFDLKYALYKYSGLKISGTGVGSWLVTGFTLDFCGGTCNLGTAVLRPAVLAKDLLEEIKESS